jgi:hypothetical protein
VEAGAGSTVSTHMPTGAARHSEEEAGLRDL